MPGWSIGSWFIPLANLVIPVLIVQDLWRGAAAETRRGDRTWRTGRGSALVGCWWASWVVASVGWWVRITYSDENFRDNSLDDIETSNTVALVGVVAVAIAAVLALLVVRALSRRQLDALHAQRVEYELGAA
jgi:hypothetical protein